MTETESVCRPAFLPSTPEWWTFILMGLLAIVLGVVAVTYTEGFILAIGYLIGFIVIIYSALTLVQGIKSKEGAGASLALILLGILGLIIGFLVVTNILATWFLVTYLIAFWAFLLGIENLMLAFAGDAGIGYKILLAIAGILAIILGIYVIAFPLAEIVLVHILGIFTIVWGFFYIAGGLMLKAAAKTE